MKITIVGNNNVGKSSLFNFLTKSNQALVSDSEGITIDRNYGKFYINNNKIICIDTISYKLSLEKKILNQLSIAIQEANIIIFLVDASIGLTYHDIKLSKFLHCFSKPKFLLVNKIETHKNIDVFWELGFKKLYPISLHRKIGIHKFLKTLTNYFITNCLVNSKKEYPTNLTEDIKNKKKLIKNIVIIGLPNVGKSTLVNTIIKQENRILVNNIPGTTHDAIEIDFSYKTNNFKIIDTAGIIKSNNQQYDNISKIIKKSLKMIHVADLIIFLLDATNPLYDKNSFILNYLLKIGRNFIIVVNKIDKIDKSQKIMLKQFFKLKFSFLKFNKIIFISALYNLGINNLLEKINKINNILKTLHINTYFLNKLMNAAVIKFNISNQFFISHKIKLKYAHLGGWNPILIIIHGKNVNHITPNYKQYLHNFFTSYLRIEGHQIKIYFKQIY